MTESEMDYILTAAMKRLGIPMDPPYQPFRKFKIIMRDKYGIPIHTMKCDTSIIPPEVISSMADGDQ